MKVLLGMGSNIEPEQNLTLAAATLRQHFDHVRFSSVYRSEAVGMKGDDFLNACCLLETDMVLEALRAFLKKMEDAHGRDRSGGSWKPRTLDLDVLMMDGKVIDQNLMRYAHAFVPAAELVDLGSLPEIQQALKKLGLQL